MTESVWLPEFGAAEGARELCGVTPILSIQIAVRNTERFRLLELTELDVFYNM